MQSPIIKAIHTRGLSIYDPIQVGDEELWIATPELEALLRAGLEGISLKGLPLRTRSKVVKAKVCELMGYPVPSSFKKVQPRFTGQNLDIYIQKSRNLQIWNEEISSTRRYAIIAVDANDVITTVKVVNGDSLAKLDTTGTLTQKYQAGVALVGNEGAHLLSLEDSQNIKSITDSFVSISAVSPIADPSLGTLLPIQELFLKLKGIVGSSFDDIGYDQERNRAALLHRLVVEAIGYNDYKDDGQFPDVRNQLLEVKLQTSPTIDLGLVSPDSDELLDTKAIDEIRITHSDVRYAIFGANITDGKVYISHFFLVIGNEFFNHFRQFQGNVLNKKLQIPLPRNFFS